ncbi:MAG: tRNA-guanine transglycosylase, partial [Thermoprotei archaeon]
MKTLLPDEIFEIAYTNLGGRIGHLATKRGRILTPTLLPVIDKRRQLVDPVTIRSMGFEAVITNAYLLLKRKENVTDIHSFINFDGVVMTDSGAYQLLEYGNISVSQREVVELQERINVDIGVMLDTPTGAKPGYREARKTVQSTLENARRFFNQKRAEDILWVGPVQGGQYSGLVSECAS